MFIHQYALGPWDNFQYFIGDREARVAAVVDPAWHLQSILDEEGRLDVKIDAVLCTHSHFDHVDQVEHLLKERDVGTRVRETERVLAERTATRTELYQDGDATRVRTVQYVEKTIEHEVKTNSSNKTRHRQLQQHHHVDTHEDKWTWSPSFLFAKVARLLRTANNCQHISLFPFASPRQPFCSLY